MNFLSSLKKVIVTGLLGLSLIYHGCATTNYAIDLEQKGARTSISGKQKVVRNKEIVDYFGFEKLIRSGKKLFVLVQIVTIGRIYDNVNGSLMEMTIQGEIPDGIPKRAIVHQLGQYVQNDRRFVDSNTNRLLKVRPELELEIPQGFKVELRSFTIDAVYIDASLLEGQDLISFK